ncbi:hypothetical protein POJ06DRAFT_242021 [Lipomyces tetrasporus]|uniref:dihydropyrimidinase n=1 Tax=Lipomyces tetrasporus TaxID=54092 RepID=A0AAD7R0P9_9ASCO|nr:uncharacterized protein POJ06DRAFT_242021 [Lipomyces tetrasporus]KAJ8103487.1 hypothetical protein POJ06DRAFT_242021 [Lipomyces tetrasporus]
MNFDLVITNGIVVTSSGTLQPPNSDIAVTDGVITHVGRGLTALAGPDTRIIDAEGAHVTPGGVDTHVHLSQGAGGVTMDGFDSGTRSAVCGGTTTVVCFAAQEKWDEDVLKVVNDYHAKCASQGGTYSDYGFHLILTNPTPAVLDEQLPILRNEGGISSVKLYMTYDNRQLSDAQIMAVLARTRQLGMTTMIHAENWDMIKFIIKQLEQRGQTDPYFHAVSRPPLVETEAAYRAICIAELMDTPILLVHVSTKASRDHVRAAQTRMLPIHAETCPQYLYLMSDVLKMPDFEGAKYVCSPPVRDSPDDIAALWEGIANGTFTTLSSDHCPSCWDHPQGKKLGLDVKTNIAKFSAIPNGLPGVETRLPLGYQGVTDGKISIEKLVEVACTNPSKLYGLEKKGVIAPGYDADIVIWYPSGKALVTVENGKLHHKVDYTPYEGFQLNNWPRYTILRGKVVWARDDGGLLGQQGYGKFVKRIGNQLRQSRNIWVNEWRPFVQQ